MTEIRRLIEGDFDDYMAIVANAYPAWGLAAEEARQSLKERLLRSHNDDPTSNYYGLFREERLLGGMRLLDFRMNMLGCPIDAAGLGLVAVDLLHKKEKVARDMVRWFLQYCRERGATIASLYPFRPDFYKQMGFGYGPPMHRYRVRPAALPRGPAKARLRSLTADDKPALADCYHRVQERTHGLNTKTEWELDALFRSAETRVVGCMDGDTVRAYAAFTFKKVSEDNFIKHEMYVRELVYETREALSELLTFLHTQADQVSRIVFTTQDEHFHHLLSDPLDGSDVIMTPLAHQIGTVGLGIMYRVTDVQGLFEALAERDFGGQTCRLRLVVRDSFLPENDGSTVVGFREGRAQVAAGDAVDVEVSLDVAEFSSLVMGAVPFKVLYRYGLADISDAGWLETVNRIFAVETKPMCLTDF